MLRRLLVVVLLLATAGCGGAKTAASQGGQLVKRYASVAETADDYARIFGKPPNAAQNGQIPDVLGQAKAGGFSVTLPSGGATAAQVLLSDFRAQRSGFVVVVGHNESGSLRFADGSELALTRLDGGGAVLVAISCDSAKHVSDASVGLPTRLTYDVAFLTERKFSEGLTATTSLLAARQLLDAAFLDAVRELKATRVKRVALVGSGLSVPAIGISIHENR